MNREVNEFINAYLDALRDGSAAIFAGAGLSAPAGFVNWRELMRSLADDLALDVDRETDLIALAQYHLNERRGRHRINQILMEEMTRDATLTENHQILGRLPIGTFWTTNYDSLIENALEVAGKRVDTKRTPENLAVSTPRRDAVVYKMHGDRTLPENAVVTKDDYEAYNNTRQLFTTALRGDLVSKTFLFVGLSFTDPNLDYILSRIRVLLGENRREHYALLKSVQRDDFSNEADYLYAKTKQDLQINDLRRYGIIGVMVDEYSEITQVFRAIEHRYKTHRVFISGSASSYDPMAEDEAEDFIEKLSSRLIANDFHIVSGFGEGVGSFVINGTLAQIDQTKSTSLGDHLTLKPFPQRTSDSEKRRSLWRQYREGMIPLAGIALFIFGNKESATGGCENAQGVIEEFEIAEANGLVVVPIGATGYASSVLHQRVLEDFDRYYGSQTGLQRKFEKLGKKPKRTSSLIDEIVDFLTTVRQLEASPLAR